MINFLNIIWRHKRRRPKEDGVDKILTEVGSKASGFLLHDDGTTLRLDDGGKIKI